MNLPISIRGARQHNLRNLDLDLPSNKLIVFCGPSGSGKSSLAFDTLFSESRRRFLDCLSARSRQGMDQPEKPEVDSITGCPRPCAWSNPPGSRVPAPAGEHHWKSGLIRAPLRGCRHAPMTRRQERNWNARVRTGLRRNSFPCRNTRA